ncbi:MAG: PEP/pyruvate-binding domain-containing protein [Acidobacteriota bacterium]
MKPAWLSDLAAFRVNDVLLVSSLYDSFILAEAGELHEEILKGFLDLYVRRTPGVTHVSTVDQAITLARDRARYNLIIASIYIGDESAASLAQRLRDEDIDTPVVALAYDMHDVARLAGAAVPLPIDRVFLWQGDVRLIPAIVKYVEDQRNVAHDTGAMGVQVMLVIEDNVRYYSSFLPMIDSELTEHAHSLVPEGVNLSHKLLRMQAQPKILLCGSYEQAWQHVVDYEEHILGVISDVEFPRGGRMDPRAGLDFATQVRLRQPDVPVLLQSSRADNQALARSVGASFVVKGSPTLLQQLRRFMAEQLGFGDFVFRMPDGREVGRARDLRDLEEQLATLPAESVAYHAARNHFSKWFKARTEFALAHELRPRTLSDFGSVEELRLEVLRAIRDYRRQTRRGVVVDFDRETFNPDTTFCRIGGGALGGKARGLAFVDHLLRQSEMAGRHEHVRTSVPPLVVLGTDVFDEFLEQNHLRDRGLNSLDLEEIESAFLRAELPGAAHQDLSALLSKVHYPLAVRSSSLLEDSQYQPFAGIYATFMLPNDHPRLDVRLRQLLTAIKRVYASTFSPAAKRYFAKGPYRLEEEKMAVVLQRLVGSARNARFYPDLAGVVRSYNFYPLPPMQSEDGIAAVALGLGETVVSGQASVRFCPRYPRHAPHFSSVADTLAHAQRSFFALELGHQDSVGRFLPSRFELNAAELDGTLARVGSTYSPENDVVYDGVARPGVRLVTLAPLLKHGLFPLAEMLSDLLEVAVQGTSGPVEIEFALNFPAAGDAEFGVLQLRPLARLQRETDPDLDAVDPQDLVCESPWVLGHGTVDDVRDVVVVDLHRFDRMKTREIARSVARLNQALMAARRPYVLIGVGRWGSADPLLGIPITWDQIAGACAIVEAGMVDLKVTPSQGSHFFQNLSAANIGYFTVNQEAGEGFVDWAWLAAQPAATDTTLVRLLRFAEPLVVAINGRLHAGRIAKPRAAAPVTELA